MKNLLIMLALVSFALIGCDESYDKHLIHNMKYVKDPKTGLCFAYTFHGVSIGMTIVPCKDVIEQLSSIDYDKVLSEVFTDEVVASMQVKLPAMEEKAVTAPIFK